MSARSDSVEGIPYVSTGHLPDRDLVKALVAEAHSTFQYNSEGQNSQVYPALARVPATLFGICVVGTNGVVHAIGDADHEFSIMSVSKPFLFALICGLLGAEEARQRFASGTAGHCHRCADTRGWLAAGPAARTARA